jgi:4-amino-4-deoxy-L-arabinose transferase-like glycosyltransferase
MRQLRFTGNSSDKMSRLMTTPGGAARGLVGHSSGPRLGLALTLLLAALLRFWALGQGIPFNVGVDEPEVMDRAVRIIKTGDLNPHFFDYPSLYIYVQAVVGVFRFLIGATQGRWASLAQAPTDAFYLWGRGATALIGTATVWILYRAGLRWGRNAALLAAVMLAVMPLHVRESHYALTDVPTTFFVVLTFLLSLRAGERPTMWAFAAAGAAAGLAGATKYNGIVCVLMPILASLMMPAAWRVRARTACLTVAAALVMFLLAAPYTFLDLPNFLNQFARLASIYKVPGVSSDPMWLSYLKHLRLALGVPGAAIAAAGLVFGVIRIIAGPDRLKWLLAIAFPLVYFRFISSQTLVFGRYLLPLVPFLSLLAAVALVRAVIWLRETPTPVAVRRCAVLAVALVAVVFPAYASMSWDRDAARSWTSQLAYDWIRREIPAGTPIRLEGSLALKLPEYRATYTKQLRFDKPETYAQSGIQYLVASSQSYGQYLTDPQAYPLEYGDYQRIFNETEEVARFSPSPDHPGPELRILKVKR